MFFFLANENFFHFSILEIALLLSLYVFYMYLIYNYDVALYIKEQLLYRNVRIFRDIDQNGCRILDPRTTSNLVICNNFSNEKFYFIFI
jgi:hypothetical protein